MASLRYIGASAPQPTPAPSAGGPLPLQSLLFPIQIGLDTSNNFALCVDPEGFEMGLAVQTPNGRFVRYEKRVNRLIDVTAFIIPVNPFAFRLPVRPDDLETGDLIVTADPPNFCAGFVITPPKARRTCLHLDTATCEEAEFVLPQNPLFPDFYVRVISPFDEWAG
jgi:hypothetical protein